MARQENDREDLLAKATALVERVELSVVGFGEPVVIGFRREGAASVYFGQDRAYHFTAAGKLRRAYVEPRLYKAQRRRLVALTRRRTSDEVQLVSHRLDDEETAAFLGELSARLLKLRDALAAGDF